MPEVALGSEAKVSGYTEIRNGEGELLVAFSSLETGDYWVNEYQKERVNYCMRHRRDEIPNYLRTGGKLPLFKGKRGEALRLRELNLKEVLS